MSATLAAAMLQTSARLLALLSLLQARREWTGQELADRLEVAPRTIRRDVGKLRSLGYPIHAAPGVAGGYRLGVGGQLPPLLLDDAEAVAVAIGLRTAAVASIAGIEETAIRALARLEPILPGRLRRRVNAISRTTAAFPASGPSSDTDVLSTLAVACRDGLRVRFAYASRDDEPSQRRTEPVALVYSGHRWYLVAYDLDRDDWRTFRLDRIRGRVRAGERGRRRSVPGGDPAKYLREQLRAGAAGEPAVAPGRIRLRVAAERVRSRIPDRYATVEPESDATCVVTSRGAWSESFLVFAARLDHPMEVIGPPELAEAARRLAARLAAAAGSPDHRRRPRRRDLAARP
jgi:predicted DNA-binding transcriptional regulator YafY